MVEAARKAPGAGAIRSLNLPQPIRVRTDSAGLPTSVNIGERWVSVERVEDRWRIDDEWWRQEPVCRLYYQLLLEDGRCITVFHDLIIGCWYEQKYA